MIFLLILSKIHSFLIKPLGNNFYMCEIGNFNNFHFLLNNMFPYVTFQFYNIRKADYFTQLTEDIIIFIIYSNRMKIATK